MGYRPLVDFHHFCLTKRFPITPSAIQPIGTPSTFCIDNIVPGFLDVIQFQSLDVAIFVFLQLNCKFTTEKNQNKFCGNLKIKIKMCPHQKYEQFKENCNLHSLRDLDIVIHTCCVRGTDEFDICFFPPSLCALILPISVISWAVFQV